MRNLLKRWLNKWFGVKASRTRVLRGRRTNRPPSFRPQLVQLEDRLAPATLGAYALVEPPTASSDSDIVAASGAASATSNASWLHTTASGTGNGLAAFTFDANAGPTRSGTLTIAGDTLTVTQAGSSYAAATAPTALIAADLGYPNGVAVDAAGNVYIADSGNNAIEEYNATTKTVSTLVATGLNSPESVAVDAAGNVYIADTDDSAIMEWTAETKTVSTLVSSGLILPGRRGGGRRRQRLHRRHLQQRRRGVQRRNQDGQPSRLNRAEFPGRRGGGRRRQRLHRR